MQNSIEPSSCSSVLSLPASRGPVSSRREWPQPWHALQWAGQWARHAADRGAIAGARHDVDPRVRRDERSVNALRCDNQSDSRQCAHGSDPESACDNVIGLVLVPAFFRNSFGLVPVNGDLSIIEDRARCG